MKSVRPVQIASPWTIWLIFTFLINFSGLISYDKFITARISCIRAVKINSKHASRPTVPRDIATIMFYDQDKLIIAIFKFRATEGD